MESKTISILGCGWLGMPLAEFLISKNFIIKGSTTSEEKLIELKSKLIDSYLVDLNFPSKINKAFFDSEILLLNLPPGLKNKISYSKRIENALELTKGSGVKKVIFISTTSVYKDESVTVTEEGPFANSEKAKELISAEKIIQQQKNLNCTILRLGGLYGYGRVPIRKIVKPVLLNSEKKLNLIHRDYVCEIIFQIIRNELWNEIYNLVEDDHPTQLEFFHQSNLSAEIEDFKIEETEKTYKFVSNFKIRNELGINLPNKIQQS